MAFKDIRFPEQVAFDFTGGPEFFTLVTSTSGGVEQRNIQWSQTRHKFIANHELKDQDELDALKSFFMVTRGRAFSFRFKDWADYFNDDRLTGVCSRIGDGGVVGDGVETDFQIRKQYNFGTPTLTFDRDIHLPIDQSGLPAEDIFVAETVYIDAAAQTSGFTITRVGIDGVGGLISFTTPPSVGEVIGWVGEWDVPCRFEADLFQIAIQHFEIGSAIGIGIVEVRPEEAAP